MIVTVTPNPSIDRSITLPQLAPGEVNRALDSRVDPGGKGINVARALAAQGSAVTAVLPAGGPQGTLMVQLLHDAGVEHVTLAVRGAVRTNIALLEPDGRTTKVNEPGPTLSAADVDALLARTVEVYAAASDRHGPRGGWVVGCGSLPPGVPDDVYASLVERARAEGARVAVDTSGAPLAAAVRARPDVIKPNLEELEELVGRALPRLVDVRDAAADLVRGGVGTVVVSLGGDGALLVDGGGVVHAAAQVDTPRSTVGAGDCLLAGVLDALDRGLDAAATLAQGVRWGSAAVALPGSAVPGPHDLVDVHATVTTDPDLTALLG